MSRLTGNISNLILMQIFILTVLNVTRVDKNIYKTQQKSRASRGTALAEKLKLKLRAT
jgi:hypothetical protein